MSLNNKDRLKMLNKQIEKYKNWIKETSSRYMKLVYKDRIKRLKKEIEVELDEMANNKTPTKGENDD